MNFTPIDPISALYWSAVINGVVAVPVMVLLMFMARRKDVMGRFVVGGPLYWLGWLSTIAMTLSVVAMAVGLFVGNRRGRSEASCASYGSSGSGVGPAQ